MTDPISDDYIPTNTIHVEGEDIWLDSDTNKYWFSSESYDMYGPYDTLEIARQKCKEYFAQL